MPKKLPKPNASEAITGFIAWLTTRNEVIQVGSCKECYDIMEAYKTYCNVNNFDAIRDEHWPDIMVMPAIEQDLPM